MITIVLLLILFGIAMNVGGEGSKVEEFSEVVDKEVENFEQKFKKVTSKEIPNSASTTTVESPPYFPDAETTVSVTSARTTSSTTAVEPLPPSYSSMYPEYSVEKSNELESISVDPELGLPDSGPIPVLPDFESNELKEKGVSVSELVQIKKLMNKALLLIFFSTSLLIGIGTGSLIKYFLSRRSKQLNNTLILTHNSTQFTILNNAQHTTNMTVQTTNITETVHNTTVLTQTAPKALPAVTEQTIKNKIVKHGNVHIEHTHTSNAQSTVYIVAGTVVTLLLIAVCILALQIAKPNKQDVCTDMQSNMNAPLHQHNNII